MVFWLVMVAVVAHAAAPVDGGRAGADEPAALAHAGGCHVQTHVPGLLTAVAVPVPSVPALPCGDDAPRPRGRPTRPPLPPPVA